MLFPRLIAALASVSLAAGSVVKTANPNEETFELLILHNNDMHARFEQTSQLSGACTTADRDAGKCYGGFPRVAYVVKEARKAAATGQGPPVLYLNAGDTYTGTAWFTIYKWKIAAEFINALQPDAVSLGNHEFDNGIGGLTPFIESLTCPVLAANIVLTQVPELAKEPNLKESIVFDIDGTKIGIIGYLTPETKLLAVQNNVEYISEIEALNREVKRLQSEGVQIIIALGHSGYKKDLEIAREVEGLNLVIGGHTNTFLLNGTSPDFETPDGPYPTYVKQSSGKLVPVVQAYAYTKYLGKLHMVFNSIGEVLRIDGIPILLDQSIPQDPEVLKIVQRYQRETNATNEVIGTTLVTLDGITCRKRECNLGNLITDAMIHKYASEYKGSYWTDTPIAILPGGGIRTSVSRALPAKVTKADFLAVMPFEGNLWSVTVNGTVLLQVLEHSVAKYDPLEGVGEFSQYSGIKAVYDLRKPPGQRLVKVVVRCSQCDIPTYGFIKDSDSYKLIMPGFVAKGGDGFYMFKGLPTQVLNYSELDATLYYVTSQQLIHPEVEGRVQLLEMKTFNTGFIVESRWSIILLAALLPYFTFML